MNGIKMSDNFLRKAAPSLLVAAVLGLFTTAGQIGWSYFQTVQTQKDVQANVESISQLKESKVSNEILARVMALLDERDETIKSDIEDVEEELERINDKIDEEFNKLREDKYRGDETVKLN